MVAVDRDFGIVLEKFKAPEESMNSLRNVSLLLFFSTLLFSGCGTEPKESAQMETTSPSSDSASSEPVQPPVESSNSNITENVPLPVQAAESHPVMDPEPAPSAAPTPPTPAPLEKPASETPPVAEKPVETTIKGEALGKVVVANAKQNFVVIHFEKAVPPLQSVLKVYRNQEMIGTVRITNPINPPHASADIVSGTIKRGDQVR